MMSWNSRHFAVSALSGTLALFGCAAPAWAQGGLTARELYYEGRPAADKASVVTSASNTAAAGKKSANDKVKDKGAKSKETATAVASRDKGKSGAKVAASDGASNEVASS